MSILTQIFAARQIRALKAALALLLAAAELLVQNLKLGICLLEIHGIPLPDRELSGWYFICCVMRSQTALHNK